MKRDRISGVAMIVGMLGAVVTMALHPIGGHLRTSSERLAEIAGMARGIHILGIVSISVLFFGLLGLGQAIGLTSARARAGLVAFGLSWIAVVGAATASGLIGPELIEQYQNADVSEQAGLHAVWDYNRHVNHVLDHIFIVATCVGMALWSMVFFRYDVWWKVVGVLGLAMAAIGLVSLVGGYVRMNVSDFRLVIIGYAVWGAAVGGLLCRPGAGQGG